VNAFRYSATVLGLLALLIRFANLCCLSDDTSYNGRRKMSRKISKIIFQVFRRPRLSCITRHNASYSQNAYDTAQLWDVFPVYYVAIQ